MPLLPNVEFAEVPIEKLRDYALNQEHPLGKHKAKVFESALGLKKEDAEFLQLEILKAAFSNDAILTQKDEYGQRYNMEFEMTVGEKSAIILTAWILFVDELRPRMTTCYVK